MLIEEEIQRVIERKRERGREVQRRKQIYSIIQQKRASLKFQLPTPNNNPSYPTPTLYKLRQTLLIYIHQMNINTIQFLKYLQVLKQTIQKLKYSLQQTFQLQIPQLLLQFLQKQHKEHSKQVWNKILQIFVILTFSELYDQQYAHKSGIIFKVVNLIHMEDVPLTINVIYSYQALWVLGNLAGNTSENQKYLRKSMILTPLLEMIIQLLNNPNLKFFLKPLLFLLSNLFRQPIIQLQADVQNLTIIQAITSLCTQLITNNEYFIKYEQQDILHKALKILSILIKFYDVQTTRVDINTLMQLFKCDQCFKMGVMLIGNSVYISSEYATVNRFKLYEIVFCNEYLQRQSFIIFWILQNLILDLPEQTLSQLKKFIQTQIIDQSHLNKLNQIYDSNTF